MKITISGEGKQPIRERGVTVCLDDINGAIDGGLYAELLENRNFESKTLTDEGIVPDGGYAWEAFPEGANVALKIKTDRPLVAENPHYMRITAHEGGAGMRNLAYGGFSLERHEELRVSLWLRAFDYKGKLSLAFCRGEEILFEKKFKVRADGKWHRYAFKLKAKAAAKGVTAALLLKKAGMVHADCFSVMPQSAVHGIFRKDFVRLMKDMKPGFIRFAASAGGYSWKQGVGDPMHRVQAPSASVSEDFPNSGQTFGIGVYELFRLAEYLDAEPVPMVEARGTDFESDVQDALDLVEFALGGTETMWGKLRADLGHGTPFKLHSLCVTGLAARRLARCVTEAYPAVRIRESVAAGGDPEPDWASVLKEAPRGFELPAFGREGRMQTKSALIRFDSERAVPTARYHVMRMRSLLTGDFELPTAAEDARFPVFGSEGDAFTFLSVINPTGEEQEVEVESDSDIGTLRRVFVTSASPEAENTFSSPDTIVPRDIAPAASAAAVLPPYSYSVLIFRR